MVRALAEHQVDRPQLQAPRGAQASGTNSPSSSPRLSRTVAHAKSCAHAGPRTPARKGARRPGRAGSALRERGHGGGDHPVPSRTRQLSPPSPRVLQRQAAGGQDAALAQGASALRGSAGGRLRAAFPFSGPCPPSRPPPASSSAAPSWGFSVCWGDGAPRAQAGLFVNAAILRASSS